MTTAPPLSFFVRGPEGLSLLVGPPFSGEAEKKLDKVACSAAKFTSDGSKLAVTTPEAVAIYDASSCKEVLKLSMSGATATAFSPRGTYLQTFQKPTGQEKNLTLWDLKTGSIVFQLFQKTQSKSNWPAIQFSDDESLACRMVTNEVHFYDGRNFQKGIIDKLRLLGIAGVQLSHAPGSHIAAYVPEMKGAPASARIYKISEVSQGEPVARRSFFKSSTAQLIWNKGSTGLLVLATSDVDKTNQSYYGETRLHFLTTNGKHEGTVPLNKEGPIHDVQWSPSGTEFIVVYGFMPARATLLSAECKSLFDFGSGPYNTVRWNPHGHDSHCMLGKIYGLALDFVSTSLLFGQVICLAGFGNLPGDVVFWDRQTLKLLGSTKAACSVTSEWSADGRYFMTATTAPRLQVDNGIKFFKWDGRLYYEKKYEKLYQAEWRPAAAELYPDRPPSPSPSRASERKQEPKPVAAKPAAYRPPNASNSAAVKAQLFGLEEEKPSGGVLSKTAAKNQRRRASKQKDSSADSSKDAVQPASSDASKSSAVSAQLEQLSVEDQDASTGTDVAKKLRALNKKLRQIQELKESKSSLTPAQQEKIGQESALRSEIKALEAQIC